ncbi:hypothetical protein AXY43_08615 [Clostridium sp. MF28]|uniref:hypothetical protein n=1 Tax=Clostridium TaxID=1485 RepID=UPI000CFA5E1C|nr:MULTISPECIES: hypothetical protein [Clostridium]AVK48084.1 hypothetical protein AXY43_08615 [Clostridium sp. MF28]PSM57143.1 hypothetical protein C4L39_13790 [Clostridium diolis]
MDKVNSLIKNTPIHLTTNTIVLIIVAIIALYILIKAIAGIIRIAALIGVCWFILMSIQSTNLINIPIIREAYTTVEKIIPSKELWTEALDKEDKINKVVNDLK